MDESPFRNLPSVDAIAQALDGLVGPRALAVEAARFAIDRARERIRTGYEPQSEAEIVANAGARLRALSRPSLRPVINASGVILQTNLGRAPLSEPALAAMRDVAASYSNLEFDLEAGERGSRHGHVRDLLRRTTGAQDGLVVNNNAAALFMVLSVLAAGREVIVSRGQAVEIGGGFRIPDVLRQSGARLVEVGTTNRTYLRDYAEALTPATAALLRVHTSNFRVIGFTHETTAAEMVALAKGKDVLVIDDLGSGCLLQTEAFGLAHEPTVQESLTAGVDLALFSGDKLLGGPQCGVIAGRADLVDQLRSHPLARALRVDKLTIAALNATLASYAAGTAQDEVPIWAMLGTHADRVRRRARRWARAAGAAGAVTASETMIGGGSLPGQSVPTWCAAIRPPLGADHLATTLRLGQPAIVGRIERDALLLDPRTVPESSDGAVAEALRRALASATA